MTSSSPKIAVVAIGGNSLIADAMRQSVPDQFEAVVASVACIADLVEDGWAVALTHGNGPQVGFALRRSELAMPEVPPMPMDHADADTQGVIGYMLQRALGNELARRGLDRRVLTVVTQVEVDAGDPAMSEPSKPIGWFMSAEEARAISARDGWPVGEDAGRGWRRLVASPRPRCIVEMPAISALVDAGFVVVCCGGGGIPVVRDERGDLSGARAVIDKDLTASLLARELGADLLAISTSVDRVAVGFRTPGERWLGKVTVAELRGYLEAGEFAAGSMRPKVEAVLEYLDAGGKRALVTDPSHLAASVAGRAGTIVKA